MDRPPVDNEDLQFFYQSLNITNLSDNLSLHCDGRFTYTECYKALEKIDNNKSPSNDGLTAECYKAFWPILGNLLVYSLNAAYINDKLSNSQRQRIIRSIEKKDKDRTFFWFSVTEWLKIFFTTIDLLTSCNIMFGLFRKDMPLLNHIMLLGKQVIYQSRHLNIK